MAESAERAAGGRMNDVATSGAYDVNRIRADFPILATQVYGKPLVYLDNAASAQKPKAVLDRLHASLHDAIRQRASRAALSRQRGDRGLRGRAGEGRGVPERQPQGRDHLHPQRHRGDQPRRLYVRPRPHQTRRRDRTLHHGAPFQHRAVAFPARAARCGHQMGAGRRRRQFPDRRIREADRPAHQDGRHHPHVEHARHAGAGQRGHAHCARPRRAGFDRRRAGRRPLRYRRPRHRLRLSTPSPVTSCTGRPGSALSTANTITSPPCRRSTAAAK